MTTWAFLIVLHLTTFGGQVTARVETMTRDGCERLRKVIVQELGGEANIKGSVSPCHVARDLRETR